MISNRDIAQIFADIADSLDLLGENRFRVAAYRRAYDTIIQLTQSLATLRETSDLTDLPNIGAGIAAMINEILDSGRSSMLADLQTKVPASMLQILHLPDIGAKTAMRLHENGISDLATLQTMAQNGTLRTIKGFTPKSEAKILEAINKTLTRENRLRLGDALPVMHELVDQIRQLSSVIEVAPAGSVRRGASLVGNLNLVVSSNDFDQTRSELSHVPQIATLDGDAVLNATLHNGMNATIALTKPESWGNTLVWWTGSRDHVAQLQARGWNPDQLFADEASLYAALDLPYFEPELREAWIGIDKQPPVLIQQRNIKADVHWHTTWSDGRNSLREMADMGRKIGYRFMAVADHSAYLGVTGGLDGERLRQQRAEIDALNAEYQASGDDFRLLQCCEVDILPDGALALPDDVLAMLDLVVASPHVALRQSREASTARLIKAIEHPLVDIIGHPTGRLLNQRDGADLDMEQVIAAAARTGTALEINASMERLDLDADHVFHALEAGVTISINTDAHAVGSLPHNELGVLVARRAGATAANVLNTWDVDDVLAWKDRRSKQ